MINIDTGEPWNELRGMGAGSDSYYEYLLKLWLLGVRALPPRPRGGAAGSGCALHAGHRALRPCCLLPCWTVRAGSTVDTLLASVCRAACMSWCAEPDHASL